MIRALAAAGALVALALCAAVADASCIVPNPPTKTVTLEEGVAFDTVTNGQNWQERYASFVARNANQTSVYGRYASDSRFGSTDQSYEAGAYQALDKHVIVDAGGSFSPTHNFLAATTETGGVDWRTNGGYGYQAQFAQRNYPTQIAGITSLGADRYFGVNHVTAGVTLANLSSVPGTAVTAHASYTRNLACDDETIAASGGRDVEPTGVDGRVAVYKTYDYSANEVHWFSQRFGIDVGVEWALLVGAYDRFEGRVGLRERL